MQRTFNEHMNDAFDASVPIACPYFFSYGNAVLISEKIGNEIETNWFLGEKILASQYPKTDSKRKSGRRHLKIYWIRAATHLISWRRAKAAA